MLGALEQIKFDLPMSEKEKNYKNTVKNILVKYFIDMNKITILENKKDIAIDELKKAETKLKRNQIDIDINMSAIRYDKPSATSSVGDSSIEKALVTSVDKILNKIENYTFEILEIEDKIEYLKKSTHDVNFIMSSFENEVQKIIELKYQDKKSYLQIANEMYISDKTVKKYHDDFILTFYLYL